MDPKKELLWSLWVEFKVCQFRVRGFTDYLDPIRTYNFWVPYYDFLIYIYIYIYMEVLKKVGSLGSR